MSNIILKIDGEDYSSKIIDTAAFKIKFQVESSYNTPVASIVNFTLKNDSNLQNIFLNNKPYSLYQAGLVEIYIQEFTTTPLFKGYIDKEEAPEDLSPKHLEIQAIDFNKFIGIRNKGYDISQIYYAPAENRGQRGNRTGMQRIISNEYNDVGPILNTMFADLGFESVINIQNTVYYKYNEDKYGSIRGDIFGVLRRSMDSYNHHSEEVKDYLVEQLEALEKKEKIDSDTTSYDSLIKDWAALCGCIYFYDWRSDKMFFINRDYNFLSDMTKNLFDVQDFIIDVGYRRYYGNSLIGIILGFSDFDLAIKRTQGIIPGDVWVTGAGTSSGNQLAVQTGVAGEYIYIEGEDDRFKFAGAFTDNIYIDKPLDIRVNDYMVSYLKPGQLYNSSGSSVAGFLSDVKDNYELLFDQSKTQEIKVHGLYTFPQRILYEERQINVWEMDLDLKEETTVMRFEY